MSRNARKQVRPGGGGAARRPTRAGFDEREERILREATIHLITHHGGLFVATAVREEEGEVGPNRIVGVTLRYPTGHEGHVGELLCDGQEFRLLTERSVIDGRIREIAVDPGHLRCWQGP